MLEDTGKNITNFVSRKWLTEGSKSKMADKGDIDDL